MQAEVIAIGDELTSGQRLDTNSQWLSQQLGEIGFRTLFHTTVGDDLTANVAAFRQATRRADIVIATGGLGPTADDLTRQSIAEALQLPLELHEPSLEHIRSLFAGRGREMPERNRIQAMVPRGSRVVGNPHGTAPGIDVSVHVGQNASRVFALPGVPAEMKQMWQETVRAELLQQRGDDLCVVRHYRLKCFGTGESAIEAMLPNLIRRGREPIVGITASQATITLRITAKGRDEAACLESMRPTIETIRTCLGELVFGEEDEELQHAVTRLLRQRKETLATCEWGSGGIVAHWLREVPESQAVFAGGIVIGDSVAAERLLGVETNLDSREHVMALASAVRARLNVDYALSMSAFPDGAKDAEPNVYLGLATRQQVVVASRRFAGHPDIQTTRAAKQALDLLRLHLLKLTSENS